MSQKNQKTKQKKHARTRARKDEDEGGLRRRVGRGQQENFLVCAEYDAHVMWMTMDSRGAAELCIGWTHKFYILFDLFYIRIYDI